MRAHPPLQRFHSRRRFKALLTNLCRQCAGVCTDAELLHLGPPDPVLSTKRWLPPDHGLQAFLVGGEGLAPLPLVRGYILAACTCPSLHSTCLS